MIFYYSATGNTKYAAGYLGALLNERSINILDTPEDFAFPADEETIGLMFPIYCWGIPPVVRRFIEKFPFHKVSNDRYLWGLCTCGDEAGTAMRQLDGLVEACRGRKPDALWSLIMPNTYVLLPGFDVDSADVEKAKLESAPQKLEEIATRIMEKATGVYDVTEGCVPRLRSAVFPVFKKWGVNTKWWHVSETCVGCGKCASSCPAANIRLVDSRPEWGTNCYSCCACYHICPTRAISYASFTKNKSQYICPL